MGNQNNPINNAKVALRVGLPQWTNPTRIQELVDYLQKHPGIVDEITLFSGHTHAAFPLELIKERCRVMAKVIPQFKALGLSTGINHITTIGHLDENLDQSLNKPWTAPDRHRRHTLERLLLLHRPQGGRLHPPVLYRPGRDQTRFYLVRRRCTPGFTYADHVSLLL